MWEITKDHDEQPDDTKSRVGYSEQHSRISSIDRLLGFESEELPSHHVTLVSGGGDAVTIGAELPKIKFRTKDDDGTVYYEGWLHDDDECLNQDAALKFAETDVGCVIIEVKRDGKWEVEIS